MAETLTIGTANIGRKRGASGSHDAIRRIHDHSGDGLWAFCEIGEADKWDEHAMLRDIFADHQLEGMNTREPVAVPNGWTVEDSGVLDGAPGIPHVSPTRTWTKVLISRGGVKLGILNGHPVAGAFNASHDRHEDERLKDWHLFWDHGAGYVKGWVDAGIPVVVTGDMNRSNRVPLIHSKAIKFEHGLDQIQAIPAGHTKLSVKDKGTFSLPIEAAHDAVWLRLHLG